MRHVRGFTLIELIAAVAVLVIFITVAVPGLRHLVAREHRADTVRSLVQVFKVARMHAVSSGEYVAVCKSRDGVQCGGSDTTWGDGWIAFVNRNRDWQADEGETILLRHEKVPSEIHLRGNRKAFNFRPLGIRSTAGSLFICTAHKRHGKAVIVRLTGYARVSETHNGKAVVCSEHGA